MVRKRVGNILSFSFEGPDWANNWAKRVMKITKEIPGNKYNFTTKEWSIPVKYEKEWREKIDQDSVEYWSDEEYNTWEEATFGT